MDVLKVINLLVLGAGRAENLDIRLLTGIRHLRNASAVHRIALILKNLQRLIEFFPADAEFTFHAGADINHAFFFDLLTQKIGSILSGVGSRSAALIKQRTQSRLVNAHFPGNLSLAFPVSQH